MANWLIEKTIDLRVPKTSRVDDLEPAHALTVVGDDRGHVWRVTVLDGGQPAELTGNVRGYFIRADGATVMVTGTLSGNTATVELADACCAVEGPMVGLMRLESSSGAVTLAERRFLVRRGKTDSIVDPGHAFPSLEHVAGQYSELYNAYQSLSAQLQTAISAVTVDSEVQGVRAWASADMASETAGDAVRGQVDAVNAANAARSETLPAGYRRLAWIRSNGTQYIITGVLQKDITHMEMSFVSHNDISQTTNYGVIFGARHYASSTQTDALILTTRSRTGKAILGYGTDASVDYETDLAVKRPQTAVFDRESATFTVNGSTVALASVSGWTYGHGMYLFAINHSGSHPESYSKVTCYGCDIWANGVLARHYVPALRLAAEGVTQLAGLYDTVNRVFYSDANGGDFDSYGIEADAVQERLQAALDDEEMHRRQIAYIDYGWEIGSISAANGGEITAANRIRSTYIPCGAGTTVICADGSPNIGVHFYDKRKIHTPSHCTEDWSSSYTAPADGYIRVVVRKTGSPDVDGNIDSFIAMADCHILFPAWIGEGINDDTGDAELYQFSETRSYENPNTFKRCFTMGVISDMHNDATAWERFAADMNERSAYIDLAACLGDTTQDTSVLNFANPSDLDGPYVYTVGNHDVGFVTSGGLSNEAVFAKFIEPLVTAQKISTETPYYYKDFDSYKIRVICLYEYEATESGHAGDSGKNYLYHRYIGHDQLQWFANALLTMPEKYGAIVLLHQLVWTAEGETPIIDESSAFTAGSGYRPTNSFISGDGAIGNNINGDCIGDIVQAFIDGGTIDETYSCKYGLESVSVTADFANKQAGTEFICYIGGHTHAGYVVHLGDHPEQLQILVPCGHTTAAGQRRCDDIRPDGNDNYYYIAVNKARKVVKLLKAGTRITGDCRERRIAEVPYAVEEE